MRENAMSEAPEICARVRMVATEQGLSQAELAKEAGVAYRLVHEIFKGTANPRDTTLGKLAKPLGVSAHYLIGRDGRLWQLVEEDMRAWHAGAGDWRGQGDVNSRSIGIELDNTGLHPFAEPLMARLEALLSDILARWEIPPDGVIGHQDFDPDRKTDPGPRFDWRRLARSGLAAWPTVRWS